MMPVDLFLQFQIIDIGLEKNKYLPIYFNIKYENMSDYSKISIENLEKLKKEQINTNNFKLNPYYKDKTSYLKIVISDKGYYIITRIVPCGACMGICQYSSLNTSDYLKYYDISSKSEWESAIDRLNIWFKDSSLKIENIDYNIKK